MQCPVKGQKVLGFALSLRTKAAETNIHVFSFSLCQSVTSFSAPFVARFFSNVHSFDDGGCDGRVIEAFILYLEHMLHNYPL